MSTKTVPFGEAAQAARPELRYDWRQAEIEGIYRMPVPKLVFV